jgi:hypothetical protein
MTSHLPRGAASHAIQLASIVFKLNRIQLQQSADVGKIRPMIYSKWILPILLLLTSLPVSRVSAGDSETDQLIHKTVFGIFLHDRGPASDRHESGIDPNWELQLNPPKWRPWRWIGSPYPMIGLTPNFKGDTSVFYSGLTYEFSLSNKLTNELTYNLTKNLFVAGSVSAALHTGPLHKDTLGCRETSDCGFGYRVLPRLAFELGTYFLGNHGLSLFYDHMSHKGILPGENEGVDHTGIRYHFRFHG